MPALSLVLLALLIGPGLAHAGDRVEFNRDIRPVLSDKCFKCHGPDAAERKGDLRLDQEDDAKADRGGYAAIVPGDPKASHALSRVMTRDKSLRMPPAHAGLSLTAEQKTLLERWIQQGAVYQRHWSFEPINQPVLQVVHANELPIDAFVRRRQASAGLKLARPAGPTTQLRRATLDLTGLPPTIEELDNFQNEIRERGIEAAYQAAIDRLLASPRFGEQFAWHWLEAARYADTDGYQNDGPREMWRWRDWVIDAFNANMPFDQFSVEQLAGDLLPRPTESQLIATAFNRNNRYNSEEGIPIDEFLLENAVDRVDTTMTVWMGLTIGCARCHDHKYDPLSQKEYYQLVDYFNDVAESGRAIKFGNSEPWITTPTDDQRQRLGEFEAALVAANRALQDAEFEISQAQANWTPEPSVSALNWGLDHYFRFDVTAANVTPKGDQARLLPGSSGTAANVQGTSHFELIPIPGLIGNGRFSLSFWMNPTDVTRGPVLSNEEPGTGRAGILVEFIEGRLRWNINTRWISGVSTVDTVRTFEPGVWVHVTLTNDGTQRASGMKIYVNGEEQPVRVIRNTNSNKADGPRKSPMLIGYSKHVGHWNGQIDELRFYTQRTLSPDEALLLAVRPTPAILAGQSPESTSDLERHVLRIAYLEQGASSDHRSLLSQVRSAHEARTKYWDSLPTTMIMRDLPEGRPSYVRIRGVYNRFGEQVERGVPSVFAPLPKDLNNDRLAFARWLFDSANPLTARVAVNRIWQQLFGRGLVKTPEDFGSQGELPSHPELLDWLASEYRQNGWNTKALLKTIMVSQTYRQSSDVTSEQLSIDPDNILLARAPRRRLSAAVLRDQALFVSGMLVERRGGPSVFPYQPAGLWTEASNFEYAQGSGDDLYRRSLYTYWKRTLAPPSMALLDAGDRENCAVKPKRTNTPLQALTLLNDVTFVEAARKLGERILRSPMDSDGDRVTLAFRMVTARDPSSSERQLLTTAWNEYRAELRQKPEAAASILTTGESTASKDFNPIELAAVTALANVLLNLDEATTCD